MQANAHQLAVALGVVFATVGKGHIQQSLIGGLFFQRGVQVDVIDYPLFKLLLHLVADVFLEPANDQAFIAEVFFGVIVRIGNGRGVQHVHQAGEASCLAVVGRCGEHDQSIRTARQQLCQFRTLGATPAFSHIMGFVDDDNVPVGLFQMPTVFVVLLESVDGNDRLVVIVERVLVAGNVVTYAL